MHVLGVGPRWKWFPVLVAQQVTIMSRSMSPSQDALYDFPYASECTSDPPSRVKGYMVRIFSTSANKV